MLAMTTLIAGCVTTPSISVVKSAVLVTCYTDAQLKTLTRQQKEVAAHNNDIAGKSCPGK